MHLFSPFSLRTLTLKNRIVVSPMCMYSSEDGFANDWHLVHLGSRAVGGAGLVFTEATAVTPDGRISPQDLGLWKDEHIEPLARVTRFIKAQGSVAGIQLAHAGRKASTARPWEGRKNLSPAEGGWAPIYGPSALAVDSHSLTPEALSVEAIGHLVQAFGQAARRALTAGFEVIEIHAAHGYLLHSFLSPLSNQRIDAYGGSLENRSRFLIEVVQEVRRHWPEDYPLFLRISATDWLEGGWTIEDSVALARQLQPLGVDLIDCSSGGVVPGAGKQIPVGSGYQTSFAQQIRSEAGIPTGAVGLITDPRQADHIIRTGQADLVFMARELLRQPYWPLLAAAKLEQEVNWPVQYGRAKPGPSVSIP